MGNKDDTIVMKALVVSVGSILVIVGCSGAPVNIDTKAASGDQKVDPDVNDQKDSLVAQNEPSGVLCIFDYDLTLSSHACPHTQDDEAFHCRTNKCGTYSWNRQCLGLDARAAVAECVKRRAFIGIASHADADGCWDDKVSPMVTENQFPELTGSSRYERGDATFAYPAIDNREHWNCEECAYQMLPTLPKPQAIRRIMRYYHMKPESETDRAHVIFWDDSPTNINAVKDEMPEVKGILVPRNKDSGNDGGCGITQAQIEAAWRP